MLCPRLYNYLDEQHSHYTTIHHERTITAEQTAAAAHVARQNFAKAVMLNVEDKLSMLVMPAAYHADVLRLSRALGGATVTLAQEDEFRDAFPDCELGAMPPFGNLYGVPVFVDSRLAERDEVVFNAGSHTDVVRMPYAEFERLAQPKTLWLTHMM